MKKIIISLIFIFSAISLFAKDALVYNGPGVGQMSFSDSVAGLKKLLDPTYSVKEVSYETLINTAWEANTALLLIPGGADLPYVEKLNGRGNQKIRSYVENGGRFIGICAGAYYASSYIEFAKGNPKLQVVGPRELRFFPGISIGPAYEGYDPFNPAAGIRAAKLVWQLKEPSPFIQGQDLFLHHNGGGYFVDADADRFLSEVTILARYDIDPKAFAIIETKVGNGKTILSGVHFETDLKDLGPIFAPSKETTDLINWANKERESLFKFLLTRLNLI